jgi:TolA-binding protein
MKQLIILMLFIGGLSITQPAISQDDTVKEVSTHSVFKGIFLSIWSKLKAINPSQKQSAKANQVYTAGIRGAEATDTLLKPYWKNDLTQDEAFQAELKQFGQAQQQLDKGKLGLAVNGFEKFLEQYNSSSLRPNALFAMSISLAGIGESETSINIMKLFLDENPTHPLANDAKQVIAELSA